MLMMLPNMAETLWDCAAPLHSGSRDSPKSVLLASIVVLCAGTQVGTGMRNPSGSVHQPERGRHRGSGRPAGLRDRQRSLGQYRGSGRAEGFTGRHRASGEGRHCWSWEFCQRNTHVAGAPCSSFPSFFIFFFFLT